MKLKNEHVNDFIEGFLYDKPKLAECLKILIKDEYESKNT